MTRVLLVDDSTAFSAAASGMLQLAGFRVFCAESAWAAMCLLRDMQVDIILTDLALPDVDGLQFIEQVRNTEDLAGIPVVVLTGAGIVDGLSTVQRLGVLECLVKSTFMMSHLVEVIRKLVPDTLPARPNTWATGMRGSKAVA